MKAGRMRHWLRLEKPAITKDAFGAPLKTFVPVATVDAAIDSVSGREYMAADREIGGLQWRITLRELAQMQSGLITFDDVEQFEQRCDIGISAGRWWRDDNGNLGRATPATS